MHKPKHIQYENPSKYVNNSPPCNVGLCDPEHVDGGLVQLHEHTIEDLAKTQQLKDLAHLRADTVDTGEKASTLARCRHQFQSHYRITLCGFSQFGLISVWSPWSIRRGKKSNIIMPHQSAHKTPTGCRKQLATVLQESGDLPSDSDDKGQFGLSWNVEVSHFAGRSCQPDLTPVHLLVLLVVTLGPLEDELPGHFAGLENKHEQIKH